MKISSKRLVAAAVVASLALAACGGDDDDTDAPEATDAPAETDPPAETGGGDLSGTVFITGSSTVEPISIAMADAFANLNPGVAMTVEGPGTGDGFAKFCNGEADGTGASRAIKEEEIASCEANGIEFVELKVAIDGLSPITSVENTAVECLSFVDLYALLGPDATGINNWADASAAADEIAATVTDLGAVNTPYPDAPLTVTAPGEESGTFDSFVELVIEAVGEELGVEDANVRPDYTASPNDNVIIEGIATNPTSLGWVGFAFVEESLDVVKPLGIDAGAGCIDPTVETIASGEFPIARPLFMYANLESVESNPAVAAYYDFVTAEGLGTLIGAGEGQVPYVPLTDEGIAETQGFWAARETGTREG